MNVSPVFATLALQAPPGGGLSILLLQFGLIFAIFYFLIIRPQQRQRKEHEERIRQVKRGDEIVTAGGVVGEIVHISQAMKDGATQATMEDRITIKSGDARLVVERGRIARIVAEGAGATTGKGSA